MAFIRSRSLVPPIINRPVEIGRAGNQNGAMRCNKKRDGAEGKSGRVVERRGETGREPEFHFRDVIASVRVHVRVSYSAADTDGPTNPNYFLPAKR